LLAQTPAGRTKTSKKANLQSADHKLWSSKIADRYLQQIENASAAVRLKEQKVSLDEVKVTER
jgi:lipopolysaccharide export system protein LptC